MYCKPMTDVGPEECLPSGLCQVSEQSFQKNASPHAVSEETALAMSEWA